MATTRAAYALWFRLVSKSVRGAVSQPLSAATLETAIFGYVFTVALRSS